MANPIQNARLKQYLDAERAILSGQSYTIGNRTLTRASLSTVRAAIDDLIADDAQLDDMDYRPMRAVRTVFIDGR